MASIGGLPIGLIADVKPEFGNNTLPANDHLADYHDQVFGSGAKRLTDFANTGKPSVGGSTYSESNVTENSADIQAEISFDGGLSNITYYFQYDTDSNFGSPSTTTPQTISATTTLTDSLSGLSQNTTYYYRIVAHNNYCNGSSTDHQVDLIVGSAGSFTTDAATCSVDAPDVNDSVLEFGGVYTINWTEPSPTPDNGYNVYYRVNGGSYQFKANVPEGNTSYDHDCADGDFSNGDSVQWLVASECANGVEGGSDSTNSVGISGC